MKRLTVILAAGLLAFGMGTAVAQEEARPAGPARQSGAGDGQQLSRATLGQVRQRCHLGQVADQVQWVHADRLAQHVPLPGQALGRRFGRHGRPVKGEGQLQGAAGLAKADQLRQQRRPVITQPIQGPTLD